MKKVIFASLIAVALVACGGETKTDEKAADSTATAAPAPVEEPAPVEAPADTTAPATEEAAH
ncbi:MAG TPA: hypothetical protein PK637_18585 [Flavobacteriales bacterium]|nr:hypothetical protein [Flavobacteriales bacterium]HRE98777.1 hypothetical protein [Flavobacteriales bacterium]HRJ34727.1 hypothetical protein [Flavobacteriales bacterium]HRJ39303.1 hypothetical protein [Flavobacteriales bacterium]